MSIDEDPTIQAAKAILMELLRSYRKGMWHPAVEELSKDYVDKIKTGIKAP